MKYIKSKSFNLSKYKFAQATTQDKSEIIKACEELVAKCNSLGTIALKNILCKFMKAFIKDPKACAFFPSVDGVKAEMRGLIPVLKGKDYAAFAKLVGMSGDVFAKYGDNTLPIEAQQVILLIVK